MTVLAKITTSITLLFSLSLAVNAQEYFLLGDFQKEIQKDTIEQCRTLARPDEIKNCLVSAGEYTTKINRYLTANPNAKIIASCREHTSGLVNSWYFFLKCGERQVEIATEHPLPEMAGMEFEINKNRATWLLHCRRMSSQSLSKCLSEKEYEFNAFWLSYLRLIETPKNAISFLQCVDKDSLQKSDFKTVNQCLNSKKKTHE